MRELFTNITIPDSWIWAKSKQIGTVINGDRGKNYPSRQHYIAMGIPFISAGNLSYGKLVVDSFNYISETKYNALNNGKLLNGDIIYCIRGTLGKCAIFDLNEKAAIASSLTILRLSRLLNRHYVFYFLQSPYGSELIKKFDNGTAQPNLSAESFASYEIPLPPLPEQHRIVAKIEELFSSLDKSIESLKTAQQQLKVYRQAVLKWAFEGKLTNKNAKEGKLPDGWKWLKLEDVVDEFVRGPFGGSLKKECFVPSGYKVYEQKNAIYQSTELGKYFINENKFNELIRFKVKPADFIVSCSGTIGKLFMIPDKAPKGIINQALLIIRINRDLLIYKFFMYLFTSSFFQRLIINDAKGTAMLNLAGVKDMKLVPVLIPPIPEQQAIVAEIESRLSVCDKIEESIEQSLRQAESLRQSILKKAFEGKLVPQDPNDEPASKLLERIKSEKEKTAIKKRSLK